MSALPEELYPVKVAGIIGALVAVPFMWKFAVSKKQESQPMCNLSIKKDSPKVVDTICMQDIEDADKKVMCRCWRSAKFPYCDGSHTKHNELTGDNVGPLIVKK
jgi:CDGSH-type Zn-finger protein